MRDTFVTIQRPEGTKLASGIHVQIDQRSDRDQAWLRDTYRYQTGIFWRITTLDWNFNNLIRLDDFLIDELFTDPDSGLSYVYKVVGPPKNYALDHQECTGWSTIGA